MATDYDAPRRGDVDELSEDSLEELKARRAEAQSGSIDVDETELAESLELPGADLSSMSGEELTVRVLPKQDDEFTCSQLLPGPPPQPAGPRDATASSSAATAPEPRRPRPGTPRTRTALTPRAGSHDPARRYSEPVADPSAALRAAPQAAPPSTTSVCPVIQAASDEARKATAAPMSSGSPSRPSG